MPLWELAFLNGKVFQDVLQIKCFMIWHAIMCYWNINMAHLSTFWGQTRALHCNVQCFEFHWLHISMCSRPRPTKPAGHGCSVGLRLLGSQAKRHWTYFNIDTMWPNQNNFPFGFYEIIHFTFSWSLVVVYGGRITTKAFILSLVIA